MASADVRLESSISVKRQQAGRRLRAVRMISGDHCGTPLYITIRRRRVDRRKLRRCASKQTIRESSFFSLPKFKCMYDCYNICNCRDVRVYFYRLALGPEASFQCSTVLPISTPFSIFATSQATLDPHPPPYRPLAASPHTLSADDVPSARHSPHPLLAPLASP